MDAHALRVLEYEKIKSLLAGHTVTALGMELAAGLMPLGDLDKIRHAQSETTEMRRCLDTLQSPPLESLSDIRPLLDKATPEGNLLEPFELVAVYSAIVVIRKVKGFFQTLELDTPLLKKSASCLGDFHLLENEITKVIDDKAQIKDTASHDLLRIRKRLRHERSDLTARVEKYMRNREVNQCLQENFFTIRDSRFVLPIRSKYKGKIQGIIHDVSDTGETAFIEPIQFVEQGNTIRNLEIEEEREVRRILIMLTGFVRRSIGEIRSSMYILGHVDLTLAKARYSVTARMEEPRVTTENYLKIERGRHPILINRMGDKVVPLDVHLGKDQTALVVTGPNTGGKTVVLKTVGAILLMAWSGMHVPAGCATELPLLDDIYADIGDEQSLEQSLSTFSSHITHIRNIIESARPKTMIMLDELGAGTDPIEGAALGRAILSELRAQGCLVFVTTHLAEIKVFAYLTEGIASGAMEFDEESLRPTFRLKMGSTGSSNAIRIAEKLGMPPRIIRSARSFMEVDSNEAEIMLRRLEEALADAAKHERTKYQEFEKVRSLREELQRKQSKIEKERQELINRTRLEAGSDLEKFRKQIRSVENELRDLNQAAEIALSQARIATDKGSQEKVRSDLDKLDEKIDLVKREKDRIEKEFEKQFVYQPPKRTRIYEPKEISVGAYVTVEDFAMPAEVMAIDERKNHLVVSVATLQLTIPIDRVTGVYRERPGKEPLSEKSRVSFSVKSVDVPYELDVHGLTVDEALPKVHGYIDDAAKSNVDKIIIVHGRGRGILRDVIRQELSRHPVIRSFEPGGYHDGGDGVTIAFLKSR